MGRRAVIGVALAVLGLSGCGDGRQSKQTFRYKMTVEVETPDGIRHGNAVRELRFTDGYNGFFSLGESKPQVDLVGEAVAVDLPGGRTLFALLSGSDGDVDYGKRIADRTGLWRLDKPLAIGTIMGLYPDAPKTEKLTYSSALPMLVTFKDINDPTSVERVDPDNFGTNFGVGYRLKLITVQVTDESVTLDIGKRLEAVGILPDRSIDNEFKMTTSPTLAQRLGYKDFVKGAKE